MSSEAVTRSGAAVVGRPSECEVDPRALQVMEEYLAGRSVGQEVLIPLLHRVQEELGYLPFPVLDAIADRLGLSPVQVYGVVSFYHFFTTVPRGHYQLKVCMGTACFVRHAQRLIETIHDVLDLDIGGVTEDGLFSLEQVRCIGACGLAPAMMVNNEVHGNLNATEVRKLVRRLRSAAAKARTEEGDV